MRTTNQVAIYCAFKENGRNFYMLAKRIPERGGFWQAFTGGEEYFDNGDLLNTIIREIKEELGIKIKKEEIIKLEYSFSFKDKEGIVRNEECFGVLLSPENKQKISLSSEHDALIYSSDENYIKSMLKFEENKIAFEKFVRLLLITK